jgi:hypothetical protein
VTLPFEGGFGVQQLVVSADALQELSEPNEQNNVRLAPFTVAFPNLQIVWNRGDTLLDVSPTTGLLPGISTITVGLTVINRRDNEFETTLPVDRVTTTDYLLQKLDLQGLPTGEPVHIGFGGVPRLAVGEVYNESRLFLIPPSQCPTNVVPCPTPVITTGQYVLIVKLDSLHQLVESVETDNAASVLVRNRRSVTECLIIDPGEEPPPPYCPEPMEHELSIGRPQHSDLRVTDLFIEPGDTEEGIPTVVTVLNDSDVPTEDTTSITLWFSRDRTLDARDIPVPFGRGVVVPTLDPHEDIAIRRTVFVHDVPRGDYYIFVQVDPENLVPERNEQNNVFEGPFVSLD